MIRHQKAMDRPKTAYAKTGQGDIAYQVVGKGPLDLLLINPMSRTIEALWDYPANTRLLERLAAFSRLILFDRRGSGISDPLAVNLVPTWEDWLEDILALLDHLGIREVALLAERDAASAGLLFAASHPDRVRAMVLCNTSARFRVGPGYPIGESEERAEQLSQIWERTWGTAAMVASTRPTLAGDPEYVRWVTRMQRIAYSPGRAGSEFRYIINFDARSVLSAVHTPTLILHRQDFAVVPAEQGRFLAEHLRGSRLELLPGGDMDVLLPGDERPLELIETFLAGVLPVTIGKRALATVLAAEIAHAAQVAASLGEARWNELLETFHVLVRAESQRYQGAEVGCADSHFVAGFDGPARALRCARAIRQLLHDRLRLDVRVGLHAGECERVDGRLAGPAVEICKQVLRAAHAGEVLVSAAVKELVADVEFEFRSVGVQRLHGTPDDCELLLLER
jgi:pimeloyl-ACP methyl ester carboxylesterase